MFNEENQEEMGCDHCMCNKMGMMKQLPKEFKVAILEKKEKMLQAKLEFIGKMKQMAMKAPEEQK